MKRILERVIIGACGFGAGIAAALIVVMVTGESHEDLKAEIADLESANNEWAESFDVLENNNSILEQNVASAEKEIATLKEHSAETNDKPREKETDEQLCARAFVITDKETTAPEVYKQILRKLSGIYDVDVSGIANMTIYVHDSLAEKNIDVSCYKILQGMRFLNSANGSSYAESLAVYSTLREQGQSHDKAISSLRALGDAFERHQE